MIFRTVCAGIASALLAACARGPDAVIPPPWHPASVSAEAAPPIETPALLDAPADAKPVRVSVEPAATPSAPKPSGAPAAPAEGGHGAH